jgi:hypothetical protein
VSGRRSLPAETIDYVSKVSRLIGLGAPSDGFLGGCSSPSAAASDLFVRPGFEASSDHRDDDNGSKTNREYRSIPTHALSIFRRLRHPQMVSLYGDPQNETGSIPDLFLVLVTSFWRVSNFGWGG